MSAVDFPRKLVLVAETLGCRTQKELLGRLLAINPDTSFDPVRAYKWLQGRATPRDPGVYEDLAQALGLSQSGEVLRTCSYDAFAAMVAGRAGAVPSPDWRNSTDLSYLDGGYVFYLNSFSKFPTPKVFRCTARIATSPAGRTAIRMDAPRPDHVFRLTGTLDCADRMVYGLMLNEMRGMPSFLWFAEPVPPVRVIGGLIGGRAGYIASAIPNCSRLAMVRAPDPNTDLTSEVFYFDHEVGQIAGDLEAIGYTPDQCGRSARHIIDYLAARQEDLTLNVPAEALDHLMAPFFDG